MRFRDAYTALLVQLPAAAVGILAGTAGFLGAAIPATRFGSLGAGGWAVEDGMRWASTVGGCATIGLGLLALLLLARGKAGRGTRVRGAMSMAACAVFGPVGGWIGATLGGLVAGDGGWLPVLEETGNTIHLTWPMGAAGVCMAIALGLSAWGRSPPR